MRRVSISDPPFTYDPEDAEGFRAGMFRFGPNLGAERTGTTVYELPPGEYKVRIDSPPPTAVYKEGDPLPTPGKQEPRQLPAQYASFETSGLSLTVGGDSPQNHDFALP